MAATLQSRLCVGFPNPYSRQDDPRLHALPEHRAGAPRRSTARRGEAASGRERAAVGALEGVAAAVHILVNVRVKQGYLEGRIASLPVNIKEAEQADMNATGLTGKEYEGK